MVKCHIRLSKNYKIDFRDRAAGDVCRGQKAPCAFNKESFLNFFKVQKAYSACRKDFFDRRSASVLDALREI